MKKRFISLILIMSIVASFITALPITVSAETSGTCGDNLTWNITNKILTINGTGDMYDYSPDTQPWDNIRYEKLVVNEGVTKIGNYAFYSNNCTSVHLPNTLIIIGAHSFHYSYNLKAITIPDSVTQIDEKAFLQCYSLSSVAIGKKVKTIGEKAFLSSGISSIDIPDSVTYIGCNAFGTCENLTTVKLGNGLTAIEEDTFSFCSSLSSVTISNNITNICDGAFRSCTALTTITIPNSVTYIGSAFINCSNLTNVVLGENIRILDGTFAHCEGLTKIKLPDSIEEIGDRTFICTNLQEIMLPKSLLSIGIQAFYDCSMLHSIYIYNEITSIELNAFMHCNFLNKVYYYGTSANWNKIIIKDGNDDLLNAIDFLCLYDTYSIKKASILIDNPYYNICKISQHPHNVFASELDDEWLFSAYYTATEDVINFKSTNFYTIVLYKALFENNQTEHITQTIDNIVNEHCGTKFAMICSNVFSDAFAGDQGGNYYQTAEFLDKTIGINDETLLKLEMATDYTKDIGEAFEIISFAGKTYRTLYEAYKKAYTLSLSSDIYMGILDMLSAETNDSDMKNAIEQLKKDMNSSFSEIVTMEMLSYDANTMLNYAKDAVIECIGKKFPPFLLYKYAYDIGKLVADGVYNAKSLSYDALCISAIDNVDEAFRKALSDAEGAFIELPQNDTSQILTTMADSYKSLLLYGCDVAASFAKSCATGGLKTRIFGPNENCMTVSDSINTIKLHYQMYDFYSGLENDDIQEDDENELEKVLDDFINNENNHISPSVKEKLCDELNEYISGDKRITGISLDYREIILKKDETFKLVATVMPSDATDRTVIWKSLNEDVAKVENGIITAVGLGTTAILAIGNNSVLYDTCYVNVISPDISFEYNFTETESGTKQLNLLSSNIPENSLFILAGYNAKGQMIKSVFPETNSQLTINLLSKDISIIKCFVWNNFAEIKPLCNAKEILVPQT